MPPRIQQWLSALPRPVQMLISGVAVLLLVVPMAAIVWLPAKTVRTLIGYLPWVGLAVVVVIVVGLGLWFWWQKRLLAKQMERNKTLPQKAVVRLILPQGSREKDSWRDISVQAMGFAMSLSDTLRQNPDLHIALEVIGTDQGILFQIWTPEEVQETILESLNSAFPATEAQVRDPKAILEKPDALAGLDPKTKWMLLGLAQDAQYPLRAPEDFKLESLSYVLGTLGRKTGMGRIGFQLILKAPDQRWNARAKQEIAAQRQALAQQAKGGGVADPKDKRQIEILAAKADALTGVSTTLIVFAEPKSEDRLQRAANAFTVVARSAYNTLNVVAQGQGADRIVERHFDWKTGRRNVLSAEELAPLWHIPKQEGDVRAASGFYLAPPYQVVTLAQPPYSPKHRILGMGLMPTGEDVAVKWTHGFDTLVHAFIAGATGAGKSTLIGNLMIQDVYGGAGTTILLEPHRDLTLSMIQNAPRERLQDYIWINPTNPERSFGINLMDTGGNSALREAASSALMGALERIIGGEWEKAVQMKRLLKNAIQTVMLTEPEATMLHLMDFFRKPEYRQALVDRCTDDLLQDSWRNEFMTWTDKKQADALGPVFNRLEPLLTSGPTVRHVVSQTHTTLNMRRLVASGKVILIDLAAKDPRVGAQNAEALGALVVNLVWATISSRVKGTYSIPCYFWVDEFHTYVSQEFEKILAEARGFGLGMVLATQYYGQLPDWMQAAVLTNCRTKIVGAVESPDEAVLMKKIFEIEPTLIRNLDKYTYMAKVATSMKASSTFTLRGMEPAEKHIGELYAAYLQSNGGKLPMPADHGAVPYDPFEGVGTMDNGEYQTWRKHRTALRERGDLNSRDDTQAATRRGQYLADLPDEEFAHYRMLRRKADYWEYQLILQDPSRVPDVELEPDEIKKIGKDNVYKVKLVRRLSSLQVETPRDEIEAERLRLKKRVETAQSAGDMASGTDWI